MKLILNERDNEVVMVDGSHISNYRVGNLDSAKRMIIDLLSRYPLQDDGVKVEVNYVDGRKEEVDLV